MPTLPVPLIVSLILFALLLREVVARNRAALVLVLIAACALQGVVVALVQHYGWQALRPVQPVSAAMIPALAWVSFVGSALRPLAVRDLWHIGPPAFIAFCVFAVPQAVDAGLMAVFLSYAAAFFWALRQGSDALPRLALGEGSLPLRLWQVIAVTLVLSALSDALIVAAQMLGRGDLMPWIITFGASGNLLLLGMVSLHTPPAPPEDAPDTAPAAPTPEDAEIVARLNDLMAREKLYLDPDLTLSRLARRLHLPVKALSGAINRQTGDNVSRYINAFRITEACRVLAQGQPVTEAMLAAGFNTKSNFNREFRRITGKAPSDWRAGA